MFLRKRSCSLGLPTEVASEEREAFHLSAVPPLSSLTLASSCPSLGLCPVSVSRISVTRSPSPFLLFSYIPQLRVPAQCPAKPSQELT